MMLINEAEKKKRIRIATIGKVLSAVGVILQILIIILFHIDILTSEKAFVLALGFLPWVRYIYALVFSDVVVWDEYDFCKLEHNVRTSYTWKESHIEIFQGKIPIIQSFILLHDVIMLFALAQIHRGWHVILIIWGVAFLIMMTIGFVRINCKDKKTQLLFYGFIAAVFTALTVNTTCYALRSPARHESCTFVLKSCNHSYRSGTHYYVTVKLKDGSTYESKVARSLYNEAETAGLKACYSYGPFGIEYLRVHD